MPRRVEFVPVYNARTGKKLRHLVPRTWIERGLAPNLRITPQGKARMRAREARAVATTTKGEG